jgi:hypothetical protein
MKDGKMSKMEHSKMKKDKMGKKEGKIAETKENKR